MKQGISRRTLYLRRWRIVPDHPTEDSRMIDVTAVSDRVTAGDLRKHLRTEQTMGVRKNSNSFCQVHHFFRIFLNACFFFVSSNHLEVFRLMSKEEW